MIVTGSIMRGVTSTVRDGACGSVIQRSFEGRRCPIDRPAARRWTAETGSLTGQSEGTTCNESRHTNRQREIEIERHR